MEMNVYFDQLFQKTIFKLDLQYLWAGVWAISKFPDSTSLCNRIAFSRSNTNPVELLLGDMISSSIQLVLASKIS